MNNKSNFPSVRGGKTAREGWGSKDGYAGEGRENGYAAEARENGYAAEGRGFTGICAGG